MTGFEVDFADVDEAAAKYRQAALDLQLAVDAATAEISMTSGALGILCQFMAMPLIYLQEKSGELIGEALTLMNSTADALDESAASYQQADDMVKERVEKAIEEIAAL